MQTLAENTGGYLTQVNPDEPIEWRGLELASTLDAPRLLDIRVSDPDGKVKFLLPGEGDFDYPAYFREMAQAGYTGCITAEVSAQIFNQPGYDPWPAARFCLETLRNARETAHPHGTG